MNALESVGIEPDWEATSEIRYKGTITAFNPRLQQKWRKWNDGRSAWDYEWRDVPVEVDFDEPI